MARFGALANVRENISARADGRNQIASFPQHGKEKSNIYQHVYVVEGQPAGAPDLQGGGGPGLRAQGRHQRPANKGLVQLLQPANKGLVQLFQPATWGLVQLPLASQ